MRVAIFHKWNNIHVGYTDILQFELGEYIWEMVSQCEKVRYLGWYNLPIRVYKSHCYRFDIFINFLSTHFEDPG